MAAELNLAASSTFKTTPKFSFGARIEKKSQTERAPAPGDYRLVSTELYKCSSSPGFNFGATQSKNKERGYERCPEPGQYKPTNPRSSSSQQRWSFGPSFGSSTPSRFKYAKPNTANPAPGHYEIRKTVGDGQACSIRSRSEPKIDPKMPGPGHYQVTDKSENPPRVCFGKSERPSMAKASVGPAPGHYRLESMLEGGITKKSMPRYTMGAKAKEPPLGQQRPLDFFPAGSTFK